MKRTTAVLWGLVLIALGICYAGNTLWDWEFSIWSWWSLIILIPSLGGFMKEGPTLGNITGIVIGALFLPPVRAAVDMDMVRAMIVPVILVVAGLSIIFKDAFKKKPTPKNAAKKATETEYNATFSGQNVSYPNDVFTGATINAIFGSVTLDLRNSIMTEDTVIDCSAIFGGADIWVPQNVNVKVSSTPIFGGVTNRNQSVVNIPNAPTLYINATCMFGGVEIK